ncbi:hypothetical protein MMC19_000772 [Ptychographa xylographoides]|nr:hypothetical protein [Ptychographa xylographoides]
MVMEPPARVTGSHEVKLLSSLTTNGTTFTHLPLLPYNPSEHKRGIAIAWVFIVVNSSVLPIILVYSLWYGTSMSKNIIFSIVTALFGSINIAQSSRRIWRLVQKDGRLRPLGSRRGSLDFFMIQTLISTSIAVILIAIGTSLKPVSLPLISSAPSVLLLLTSLQLSIFPLLFKTTAFRISSLPAGIPLRPGIYTILEDVVAVDCLAGAAYREALNERWLASERFRSMMWAVSWAWAWGGLIVGGAVLGVVVGIGGSGDGAAWRFGVGWGVPWVWAAVWAVGTWRFARRELRREREEWRVD